jgi:leucyl/phenylalanyl-tRNA--protein transferase
MEKVLKKQTFQIRYNTAFEQVILHCSRVKRTGQRGTWITQEMIDAYIALHQAGYAMSGEAWQNDELVGGFYGVRLGNCFFGESMFSNVSNASKAAFITFARKFFSEGGALIDCQVYTEHLESLGATMIPRDAFIRIVRTMCK